MSRDMMSAFELYQPDSVEGAVELLSKFGKDGWALAGGNDSFDWFKDRIKTAEVRRRPRRHRGAERHSRNAGRRRRDRCADDADGRRAAAP